MQYPIISITEKHIEGFCAAVDSVARERKYLAWLEGPPLAMSRTFVRENIQKGFPHFVALDTDTVIGWCDIVLSRNRPAFSHCGTLGIGVVKPYRGQGIGKRLIAAALEKAKLIGFTRVELTVREHNKPAIKLYENFGFVVEGLKRKALRLDDTYENLICMGFLFE